MPPTEDDPLAWLDEALEALDRQGLRRRLSERRGGQDATIVLDETVLVNFGSNDYLGLAADPRLAAAAAEACRDGWGAGASPLVSGRSNWHVRLEQRLADFEGTEAALLFPSGFAANAGIVPAIVERGDAIFADQKNHASLIDGCRLSRAAVHVYRHADVAHLAELLNTDGNSRRRLIVTDSLFSMDGDLAPLVELVELAKSFNAMLMVDEAHATGVFGQLGRGVAEHLGVEAQIDVRVGTLSKALGCSGGFVAGRRSLIEWLANRARPYVFSTAPPASLCAAAAAAIELVEREPVRRQELLQDAARVRNALKEQGWNVADSASQIIPVVLGQVDRTTQIAATLRDRGLFVPGIRPPSVPDDQSLLRISLSFGHTRPLLDRLIAEMARLA